ncbi:chemotaxis protein CheW [Natrinema saccharevitans]|uniref:Chemotaxis protein CheW n=1 Tax=Natrinema saccharevitans TaxID=301967 RepID=A0A1S8AX56_9EURY|nr:chemotaxis protein CheW [Natrinema saccharevitans]OLZ41370.1 chemotaxis protein CheW [Natrinema saccharevitans]
MAPDLSEKLLGIDIDDDRPDDGDEDDQETLLRFVFVGVGEHRLALPVDSVRTIAEPPDELTRVPRAPPAIEGLMDLRGEITAVIDPRVHFPVTEERSGRERLLVLDRPSDRQSAAIRVDDVIGVETVPESDIVDAESVADSDLTGDALEHPLVVAIVTKERDPRVDVGGVHPERLPDDGMGAVPGVEVGGGTEVGGAAALSSRPAGGALGKSVGDTFEVEPIDESTAEPDENDERDTTTEIVVEATAVVDVERLLLASGGA